MGDLLHIDPIRQILDRYPSLGYGGFQSELVHPTRGQLAEARERLLDPSHWDEIAAAIAFLRPLPKSKVIRKGCRTSSYRLKHDIEKWCRHYVSNGSTIVGALLLGFRIQCFDGWPNCYLSLNRRHLEPASFATLHGLEVSQ